jgi:hypothetical protein
VTDSNPIINVTFYYRDWPVNNGSIPYWNYLSHYNSSYMYESRNWNDTFEYYYDLRGNLNNSYTYGLVKLIDRAGNVIYSGGANTPQYPVPTCFFYSPPPRATLNLELTPTDVNPKYLYINASISAWLWNSKTFSGGSINDPYSGLYIWFKPSANDLVQYQATGSAILGHVGYTQFFPIDSYTYYMYLGLGFAGNLSFNEVTMNGINLTSGAIKSNVINFTNSPTFQENLDNSQWTLSSTAQYLTGKSPQIQVTMHIVRQAGPVSDSILIPVVSVYALLGASILMKGKNDLANRLVLYLTVFVFTYELIAYINQSTVIPAAVGLNMADQMVFALVPATAVLTIFSMISWMPQFNSRRNLIDMFAVLAVAFIQGTEVRFDTLQYILSNGRYQWVTVTYGVGDLGIWGYATIAALFSGVSVFLFLAVWRWLMKKEWFYSWALRARWRLREPL